MTGKGRCGAAGTVLLLLLAAAAGGCSTTRDTGGIVDAQGNHSADFVSTHPSFVGTSGAACTQCHGPDLNGGIARVSCFSAACHHDPVPNWSTPAVHGARAKSAPGSASGFAPCRICHGSDFAGGGSGVACSGCHGGNAPHPVAWESTDVYKHTTTATGNAPVCALCHFNEPASGNHPPADPPPGSSPGCYNETLCHGAKVPLGTHTIGWLNIDAAAAFHGQSSLTCGECHPIPSHPTCTSCHFTSGGGRNAATFDHAVDPRGTHDNVSFDNAQRTVCENCHQTSRRYRAGVPSCAAGGTGHPGNDGCHADNALINPVLNNPRYGI